MKKLITPLLSAFFILPFLNTYSQSLPDEMHLSPDGKMLLIGDLANTGLYDQSQIRSIYLTFSQLNYWTLLQNNYQSQTNIPATMVVDGITYDSVGVRFKGQTSYWQTMTSQKKSFNIETDFIDPNQDIMGYNILNLNNCFQDESFIREIFFQHQIKKHIPTAKSAYVKLYINGANWGIYPSVQQLNGDFLKEWYMSNDGTNWRADKPPGSPGGGGWGDGTAALNYLGTDTNLYKPYYTLKSTSKQFPWEDLKIACDMLENTPLANIPAVLPTYFDLDRTLWFLASEVLFADDDSYIYKGKMDYYVYWEAETGRIAPQEYDGNSVMDPAHQSWSAFYNETNPNYPLMNRLFAVPELRQRYLAHLRTLITELYDTASAFALINNYKAMIDTMVLNDPKKLYTYAQFNNEIQVLKNFINYRKNYLMGNAEVSQPAPVISNTAYYTNGIAWDPPEDMEAAVVNAQVTSTNGIFIVNVYYSNALVGNFTKLQMFDDGLHDDGGAGDGVFGATIPGQSSGSWVRFYIEAASNNPAKTVKYDPVGAEHNVYTYIVTPQMASDTSVVINELMASNSSTAADGAGEFDDWIELYNNGISPTDISGYFLTDNPTNLNKWQFPAGTILNPNSYLIIWADEDSAQGAYHCNFKLSATSEQLMLINASMELVDSVSWGQQVTDMGFARVPNGTGSFIIQQPTFSFNNNLVSVEEIISAPTHLSIYPNPSGNYVNIMLSDQNKNDIEISNMVGQTVFRNPYSERITIQTTNWQNGIYSVRCGSTVKKLVVEH